MNSETQTLQIIKANPGLGGAQIGARCVPPIQVNTVEKNICHIRKRLGKDCIRSEIVAGVNAGVEFAAYSWRGVDAVTGVAERIARSRAILAGYPVTHTDRIKEEAYLATLEGAK